MNAAHQKLVKAAEELVQRIFGDTSVTPTETRESLEELLETIQVNIDAITEDEA